MEDKALDGSIRELVAAGRVDQAATRALYALGPEIYGFVWRTIGNGDDADDVFSSVSERIWRGLMSFQWRCSLRTWAYAITHREVSRFRDGARRGRTRRAATSELDAVVAQVRTETQSALAAGKVELLDRLRKELPVEDQELLVWRVDRRMPWSEIALIFLNDPENWSDEERKREADRLKKRFQFIKQHLARRARAHRLGPPRVPTP